MEMFCFLNFVLFSICWRKDYAINRFEALKVYFRFLPASDPVGQIDN